MDKFKVGKRVLCINVEETGIVCHAEFLTGRVGVITEIYSGEDLDMSVDFGKGGKGEWNLNFDNVELLD